MTTPERSAREVAAELEQEVFRLHELENRPDVEWTEDGPQWVGAFDGTESASQRRRTMAAELRLHTFLQQHQSELEHESHWRSHYAMLDGQHSAPTSAYRGRRYVVTVSASFGRGQYEITVPGPTLDDAYAAMLDQLKQQVVWARSTPVAVNATTDENSTPTASFADALQGVIERLERRRFDRTAAAALVFARSRLSSELRTAAQPDRVVAQWIQKTGPGSSHNDLAIEDLFARWAVTDVAVGFCTKPVINVWDEPMRESGFEPQYLRHVAARDLVGLASEPRSKEAIQQRNVLRSLIEEQRTLLVATTAIADIELGNDESARIRDLIDVAEPSYEGSAISEESTSRAPELSAPEVDSAQDLEL